MDTLAAIETGLFQEIQSNKDVSELLENLSEDEALELGREAARAVIGPLVWRQLLGADRFDTTSVSRLMGVSRQALHKRVRAHKIVAVPGRGTTWFPAWQFDEGDRSVRPVVERLLVAWVDLLGDDYDPETFLAWASTPQPELDGQSPAAWVEMDRGAEALLQAGQRAARGLAS